MARSVYNRNAKEHKIQSQFMFSLDMFTNVKRKERQQPIKEPSLKYYPFFCSMCLRLYEIALSLVRVYWRYNRVSVCFRGKIRQNCIFLR